MSNLVHEARIDGIIVMKINRVLLQVFIVVTLASIATIVSNSRLLFEMTVEHTVENELPLTGDTIYSEIQNDLIRPIYVSSEMANDAFLRDWVLAGEKNTEQITRYLTEISRKHNLNTCFFVSDKTKNYYYPKGILKQIIPGRESDSWFFKFAKIKEDFRINIDLDFSWGNELIVFIDHKVYDYNHNFLGSAGLGLPLKTIMQAISRYGENYKRRVFLIDKKGNIVVHSGKGAENQGNIFSKPGISEIANEILASPISGGSRALKYKGEGGATTRINVRYLPELGWFLAVEKDDEPYAAPVLQSIKVGILILLGTLVILGGIYLQLSRQRSRYLAHKAEMLATVSHDLRHFMQTLRILLSALSKADDQQERSSTVHKLGGVVEGLDELITKFLAYFRLGSITDRLPLYAVRLSPLMAQLIREIEPPLAQEGRLLIAPEHEDYWVKTDPVLLKLILRNFLFNSIKHVRTGDITVLVEPMMGKKEVRIVVADQGKGLESAEVKKLFAKFARSSEGEKKQGDGLGLFLIAHYAKKLNCRIGYEQRASHGSCFWISVPLASESEIAKAIEGTQINTAMISQISFPLKDKQVALIGSGIGADQTLRSLLEGWGASLLNYASIEEYSSHGAGQRDVSVILVQPPDDADHVADIRDKIAANIPVIVMGLPAPADSAELSDQQKLYFQPAPTDPVRLRRLVDRLFSSIEH